MSKYESIPRASAEEDEEGGRPTTTTTTTSNHHPIALGFVALFLVTILAANRPSSASSASPPRPGTAAMLQSSRWGFDESPPSSTLTVLVEIDESAPPPPPPPCTFAECRSSHCDYLAAPYLCLFHNGGPHGGCSPVPWAEGTCAVSCDQGGCDGLDLPSDATSCDGTVCEEEDCASGQACGRDAPYQCTAGSARHGCNDDEYHWTIYASAETCSSCCDARTCDE